MSKSLFGTWLWNQMQVSKEILEGKKKVNPKYSNYSDKHLRLGKDKEENKTVLNFSLNLMHLQILFNDWNG